MKSLDLIHHEVKKQQAKWGLEHDMNTHEAEGMRYFAGVMAGDYTPPPGTIDWLAELWNKHKDNPIRRSMIAAAFLASAIDLQIYEDGFALQEQANE